MTDVLKTILEVKSRIADCRRQPGKKIALVPTMGSFHEGHLSLMRAARADSDLVVVSIFVNPTQFAPTEDLDAYPHDIAGDLEMAGSESMDLVFTPESSEMYPEGFDTYIYPGEINEALCGQGRPGHFRGVATIVAKLFNIIDPDQAYFGQKDAQQAAIIRRMVKDLDFGIDIRICPIVREADGLAMSSRNAYLTAEERTQAPVLHQALLTARAAVEQGERDASKIRRLMRRTIGQNYLVEFEYARIVDPETMSPVAVVDHESLAAVAAKVGKARLIDNLIISP